MGSFESNAPPPPTGRHAGTDIQLVHMAVLEQAMDVLPKLQDAMHWDDRCVTHCGGGRCLVAGVWWLVAGVACVLNCYDDVRICQWLERLSVAGHSTDVFQSDTILTIHAGGGYAALYREQCCEAITSNAVGVAATRDGSLCASYLDSQGTGGRARNRLSMGSAVRNRLEHGVRGWSIQR